MAPKKRLVQVKFGLWKKIFDFLNVRNTTENITKRKKCIKPYSSSDDVRFEWLDEKNYGKNLSRKGMMQITQGNYFIAEL